MAATRDRRFAELYRNSNVYESKQSAMTGLYDHSLINSLKDGEPVLGRYMAYFKWDGNTKQYIHEDVKTEGETYAFARMVCNETSASITREYIRDDIANVTINGVRVGSYKCIADTGSVTSTPIEFTNTDYFVEVDGVTVTTPQYVETIRVILGVATAFEASNSVSFKKNPPKGKLTFFEEDDVIREMINQAEISSPNNTIAITDTTSGKQIDVNIDNLTIVQYPDNYSTTSLQNKLHVNHGNTISEDASTGVLDVRTGDTIKVSAGGSGAPTTGTLDVKSGNTIKVSTGGTGLPDAGTLDVKTGNTIKVSAGGSGNPEEGTLDVKTGTSLIVSAGGTGNPEEGTINVNFDNQTIKQYASDYTTAALQNKLYVNVNNSYGLSNDGSNGIKVRLGRGLDFRSGDSTTANNGLIDVQYDDNTISLNSSNQLVVNFDSSRTNATIERKSHTESSETVYDGWGVKHDTTITETSSGLHVNFDDRTIKQDSNSPNALKVHYDDSTIKAVPESHATESKRGELYVNIDNKTITQYSSSDPSLPSALKVNIDDDTLISDGSTGVISVDDKYTLDGLYGENAIDTDVHYVDPTAVTPVVNGKTVKLVIDSSDKVLSQSASGLLATLAIEKFTTTDYDGTTALPTNVKERYRLRGKNTGTAQNPSYEYFNVPIDIYKDSSLYNVYLGHVDDTITSATDPTVISGTGDDALCFIYVKADGTYELVAVNVESFVNEAEFKDGLTVNSSTHEVSTKLWNGLAFYDHGGTPTQNKSIVARIGNGLQFGSGTDGQKPIELRLGSGLQFNGSTDGEKSVGVKTGDGIGISGVAGHEGELYINYATVGSSIRPVYWDGTTHTPVQIDYTIETNVPANAVFTDTTYTSGDEITIGTGNAINHNVKLSGGFTPTTTGTTISGYGGSGSFKVPVLTINEFGHVTNASEATVSITLPDNKIVTYTAPTYDTVHVSPAYQTIITNNAISVNEVYDSAINKLDNKLAGLTKEVIDDEATLSQAIKDEPRYYAKSTTASGTAAKTATLVESRQFNTISGVIINGTKCEVYFQNACTVSPATLNINDTGAYSMIYNDSVFDATLIEAGTTLSFVFDSDYNSGTGCYRVVGGVGSGSGGSTSGLTHVNAGDGVTVTKDYVEVTINNAGTLYGNDWFKDSTGTDVIDPTAAAYTGKTFRIITEGNYYNKAYVWNTTNSRYELAKNITETVAVSLATNVVAEGTTTEIAGVANMLRFTANGQLSIDNTWDCGTY